jgi:hypothetical protein
MAFRRSRLQQGKRGWEMKELLKRRFEIWLKMRWLKTINKEIKKRRKYLFKYKKQEYVVNKLVEEYNNTYADLKTSKSEDTE